MTKIERRLKHTEQRIRSHAWSIAARFYYTQMMPLLLFINNTPNLKSSIFYPFQLFNKTFKKYLVISCVGLIEKYMTLQIRKYIDDQRFDISTFKLNIKYEKMLVRYPSITKGQYLVVQIDFTNKDAINKIATSVLKQDRHFDAIGMDFFTAVKKIDWYDPYKYIKGIEGVKPLTEGWQNFMNMFELRHKIVHEMNDTSISISKIAGMCDSTMNFLDATDFIFMIRHREAVLDRLASSKTLRERNAAIDKAMDKLIERGKVPPEMVKKLYEQRSR